MTSKRPPLAIALYPDSKVLQGHIDNLPQRDCLEKRGRLSPLAREAELSATPVSGPLRRYLRHNFCIVQPTQSTKRAADRH